MMKALGKNFVDGFALQSYLTAEEGLSYAAQHHYDYWYIDGSIHTDFIDQWTDHRIEKLLILCQKHNIKPIYHGNFKVPLASDVESLRLCAVEYVKKEIDICAKLNCPLIMHGSAVIEPRKVLLAKKIALKGLIKSLQTLQQYANDRNVTLWLENLSNYPNYKPFSYIGTTREEFLFILSEVEIRLFFDFGHANVNAKDCVEDFFKTFMPHIAGVSMSNNDGKLDQHLALEDGSIDYRNIVKLMIDNHWHGIVGFETRNALPQESINTFKSLTHAASVSQ